MYSSRSSSRSSNLILDEPNKGAARAVSRPAAVLPESLSTFRLLSPENQRRETGSRYRYVYRYIFKNEQSNSMYKLHLYPKDHDFGYVFAALAFNFQVFGFRKVFENERKSGTRAGEIQGEPDYEARRGTAPSYRRTVSTYRQGFRGNVVRVRVS